MYVERDDGLVFFSLQAKRTQGTKKNYTCIAWIDVVKSYKVNNIFVLAFIDWNFMYFARACVCVDWIKMHTHVQWKKREDIHTKVVRKINLWFSKVTVRESAPESPSIHSYGWCCLFGSILIFILFSFCHTLLFSLSLSFSLFQSVIIIYFSHTFTLERHTSRSL